MTMIIADDHPVTRLGLVRALGGLRSLEIVSAAADVEELIEAVRGHPPEIILTDLCMPSSSGMDGVTMLQELHRISPASHLLVLTAVTRLDVLRQLLAIPRLSLVMKASGLDEILHALESIRQGQRYACLLSRQWSGLYS